MSEVQTQPTLRHAVSVLENYGDHHEWCGDKDTQNLERCECRYLDELAALRGVDAAPSQPIGDPKP